MKLFPLILFSILFSANTILSQENDCSKIGATGINVTGPPGIVLIGESGIFTANPIFADNTIKENPNYKIEYHWTVVGGKIVSGQSTSELKTIQSADDLGETLTATVTVKILPTNCTLTGSSSHIYCPPIDKMFSRKIDEISTTPPKIQKERLESIYIELKNDPKAQVFISETFNKTIKPELIRKKLSALFLYLTNGLSISPERIVFQFSKGEENLTELWIIPAGADMPDSFGAERMIKGANFQKDIDKFFPKKQKKPSSRKLKNKRNDYI